MEAIELRLTKKRAQEVGSFDQFGAVWIGTSHSEDELFVKLIHIYVIQTDFLRCNYPHGERQLFPDAMWTTRRNSKPRNRI